MDPITAISFGASAAAPLVMAAKQQRELNKFRSQPMRDYEPIAEKMERQRLINESASRNPLGQSLMQDQIKGTTAEMKGAARVGATSAGAYRRMVESAGQSEMKGLREMAQLGERMRSDRRRQLGQANIRKGARQRENIDRREQTIASKREGIARNVMSGINAGAQGAMTMQGQKNFDNLIAQMREGGGGIDERGYMNTTVADAIGDNAFLGNNARSIMRPPMYPLYGQPDYLRPLPR